MVPPEWIMGWTDEPVVELPSIKFLELYNKLSPSDQEEIKALIEFKLSKYQ